MIWRVDVIPKEVKPCSQIASQIKQLGIPKEVCVYFRQVYFIEADWEKKDIDLIAQKLLVDPVIESYTLNQGFFSLKPAPGEILITFNPGVCDIVAMSLGKAVGDMSLTVKNIRTARFYKFDGLSRKRINYLAPKILYNPLIEHVLEYDRAARVKTLDEFSGLDYKFELVTVDILGAGEKELVDISQKGCLSLNLEEMKIIRQYFQELGRNPTDCELETIAVLWSEHCAHKTFRGVINYEEKDEQGRVIKSETIDNLLKTTIMKATKEINSAGCVSVFHDNSGVVNFDEKNNVCFKVETHNHPSSLEPYGGASTGIGGVIRDILGTGCAAKPFASIDVFCFSPWQIGYCELPPGILHPRRIINGVVKGVKDYGNRMGIPTVAGAVLFDERFLGNPLVYCGTLGIIPKEKSFKQACCGDLIILAGARTGRDGIHGATFSSKELDEQTVALTSAVQIGNAIEEKKLTEAVIRARDKNLFGAITDCGAGGISSAITELAQGFGAEVYLDKVPLKYNGLSYTEIWISESQERMVFFTNKENLSELERIFKEEDAELTVVGKVTDTNRLVLFYRQYKVCELAMSFIFVLPKLEKKAVWKQRKSEHVKLREKRDYTQEIKLLLASPNIACKDWVVREYDHEVLAGSVTKPVYGIERISVSDAAVVRPDLTSDKCVIIAAGINPFYSDIDPYWMAALAIDEALRNIVASGGKLEETYILDNFSWGSAQDEELLGGLVRASYGCYDFSVYYGVPFISGKDSLYNEYTVGDKRIAIPGTLLVSAVSVVGDWRKTVTGNFKHEGELLYLIGFTRPELGASEYFRKLGITGGIVPGVDKKTALNIFKGVSRAIDKGLVNSCHDLSEGGLAVAASEMCIGSDLGANVFLEQVPAQAGMLDYEILFSESATRFIISVEKEKKDNFEKIMAGVPWGLIGCVSADKRLVIYKKGNKKIADAAVDSLKQSWLETFDEFRAK